MIKSRRMIREGHVVQTGRRGMHIGFWWETLKEGGPTMKTKTYVEG
jgi:hypothetical protein